MILCVFVRDLTDSRTTRNLRWNQHLCEQQPYHVLCVGVVLNSVTIVCFIMTYIWEIASLRYLSLSGGMVRVRTPYSLSARMDVVFDRYCDIRVLPEHAKEFKAKITSDFNFLDNATKDTDMMVDAAVIFLGQEDSIKYVVKKTGLNSCWLGGWTNDFC